MLTRRANLAFLALTAVLAACSGPLGGALIREGQPTGTLRILNTSNADFNSVLISTCAANTYGLNRLSSNEVIPAGSYRDFAVSQGCYDVKAGYAYYGAAYASSADATFTDINVPAGSVYTLRIN